MRRYFFHTPKFLRIGYPSALWSMEGAEKAIYLTFDDGPDPDATSWILDLLKDYGALGTFFCLGRQLLKYNSLGDRILEEGHMLGNHTFNHSNGWKTARSDYYKDWAKCREIIDQLQGDTLFRPPYGKISPYQYRDIAKHSQIVFWSHSSGDFDKNLNRTKSLASLKQAKPGSIMLFHDSVQAVENFKWILPKVLDHFTNLGFKFKTLNPHEISRLSRPHISGAIQGRPQSGH